jgi:DNA-directed RNA polymerase I and III subunit RPAC2
MIKKKIIIKCYNKYATITFFNENHTLGNILRYVIQSNPFVEFIGYNIPYPSENILNLKIYSNNNEQINHLILGLKNGSEIGILLDNLFCIKSIKRHE